MRRFLIVLYRNGEDEPFSVVAVRTELTLDELAAEVRRRLATHRGVKARIYDAW